MESNKRYSIYQLDLPESPEAVAFVNGFLARDRPSKSLQSCKLTSFDWVNQPGEAEKGGDRYS